MACRKPVAGYPSVKTTLIGTFLFLPCLWFAPLASAQSPPSFGSMWIEPVAEAENLPNTSVVSIVQDQQGFMWFGTWTGLYRYDGFEFDGYFHDPSDSTSLSHSWTEVLYVDHEGTLWVGTHGGGLNRFEPATETFTHFRHDPNDPYSLSQDTVTSIIEDQAGTLWVGTHRGLNRFDRETERFYHYRHDRQDPTTISNDQVRALYIDREGQFWVGTGSTTLTESPPNAGGLNRFDPATGTFTRYMCDPRDPTKLYSNKIQSLFEDSRGTFWVGTAGNVLHTMDRENGTFNRYVLDPKNTDRLTLFEGGERHPGWKITSIHEDREGVLWVGIENVGLIRHDPASGAVQWYHADPENPNSLRSNYVWSIAESRDGTLWVGSLFGGLRKVVPAASRIPHYRHIPSDPGSLSDENVFAVHENRHGTVWVGTESGAIDRFDPATGFFSHFLAGRTSIEGTNLIAVMALHEDQNGTLWIGRSGGSLERADIETGYVERARTYAGSRVTQFFEDQSGAIWIALTGGGLDRFDPTTGSFTPFHHDSQNPSSIGPGEVQAFFEDHQGTLWIGTSGGGVSRYEPETGTFTRFRHVPSNPRSLCDDRVTALTQDPSGAIWVGTAAGLCRLDPVSKAFSTILPGVTVSVLTVNRDGRIYAGTAGNGFYLIDPTHQISVRIAEADDLPAPTVRALIEDETGALWITTSTRFDSPPRVLSRYDPVKRSFRRFDASRGLPPVALDFSKKLSDGTLFYAGSGGIIRIDPLVLGHPVPPQVVLTGLKVFNDPVVPGPDAPLKDLIHRSSEIVLSHSQYDFTIDYSAVHFQNPVIFRYQFMLEGHDTGWMDARDQRSARYSRVKPGEYTFKVRVVSRDAVWEDSSTVASIGVVVKPPWWQTWWAYGIYVLLFACVLAAAGITQRKMLVRRERRRTYARELEQARKIEQAYNELKRTQTQLVQQEKLASLGRLTAGIAHEIRNPLNFINNFATLSVERAEELINTLMRLQGKLGEEDLQDIQELIDDLRFNVDRISSHGQRADGIVRGMMEHARGVSGARRATDLNALVEEYVNLAYHGMRAEKPGFTCAIERDYDPNAGPVELVPQEIGRVLLNLANNAFYSVYEKRLQAGQAHFVPTLRISTRRLNGTVEIRIADNGMGMSEAVRKRIFEPFFTTKPAGYGTGLGLSLSYDIVTHGHNGNLEVESTENEGATFIVTLPSPAPVHSIATDPHFSTVDGN